MTKVALIADTHFGVRKNNEIYLQSQTRFIVEQFVPYLKKEGINTIFMLGDLFDNRSSTNTKIMNSVYEIFDEYLKDFTIYILVGNHDTYFNSTVEINSLKFLSKFENIHIIDKLTQIEMNKQKITLVPWIVDNVAFVREFNNIQTDVCLGHFNVHGFHFNKFKKSDDGLQAKLFSKCKKVFTGHFHIRNSQNIDDCETVYIGSPYQLTRNDIDESRGFTILDLETLNYEFIDNTKSLKYIQLKFPEKFSKEKIENNIIDVHVDYDDSYNETKVEKYVNKISEFNPALPPNIFVDNNAEMGGNLNLENCSIGSLTDLMREYIDGLDVKNKEEIYRILIELYNSVKGDI